MATDTTAWWEFQPGQRVMTREGFPGVVASVEDGPVAGAEEYIVTLDNNMGGGRYASGELKPLPQAQAQIASVEHTAADDYPELGDILVRRPDHQTSIPMLPGMVSMAATQPRGNGHDPMPLCKTCMDTYSADLAADHDPYEVDDPQQCALVDEDFPWHKHSSLGYIEHALITESANTYLMPPDFETEVEEDEDGKRHIVAMEEPPPNHSFETAPWCEDCDGTGRVPADPNDPQEMATRGPDGLIACPECMGRGYDVHAAKKALPLISEGGLWDFIKGAPPPGGVGHNWSYDWCRFRRNSQCYYPKTLNEAASKTAGYAVWIPEERGFCPRIKWEDQQQCPVGEPGPHVPGGYTDATVAWEAGGQRGAHPGTPYSPHAALNAVASWDPEVRFHFTATWADVRQKAKEIAKSGGVRILAAPGNGGVSINGEVQGDTNIYMTSIVKVPGKYAIAYWECGCAWSAYSWGRTGKWKKFEGRMCSHALALNYEAQRRGMFGGQVHEDRQPTFSRDPAATTKWPGDWDRNKGRYSMKVVAAQDEAHDEPPAVEFVRTAMHEGLPPNDALRMLVVMGAHNPGAMLALALGGSFMAKVRGVIQRVLLTAEGLVANGHTIAAGEVYYPTYDPSLGLSLADRRHALLIRQAAGSDPDAAARALIQLAQRNEPEVTAQLKKLVNREHGHLVGLEHRLKTPDSLARKIKAEQAEHGGDVGKTAANISDSLRYTMLFRPEEYVKGARDTLAKLEAAGYKSRVKNYWERGDNYNGINAAMTTPTGHPFELQFHTPESIKVKEEQAHPLYKRFRDSNDHRERYILDRKMTDLFDKVEQPGGVLGVPTLKRVPRVEAPAQRAAAKTGEEHTYHLLHNFEGKPITVLRHVVNHETPDARMEVWRGGQWVTDNHYASHHYAGDPRSHIISKEEADSHIAGLAKDAARRDTPVEDHYIGLTNRVGGVHAVHPDDYDPNGDGFAKARCGAWVSVDHRGNEPRAFGDEDNYGDPPSCKGCRRSTKTASSDDPCTACGGTGEQGTGHECYLCDGSGSGEEERDSRAMGMDNSNPANGLPVGLDLAAGQQPVTALYDDEKQLQCDHCHVHIDNADEEQKPNGVVHYPNEECPYCDSGTLRKKTAGLQMMAPGPPLHPDHRVSVIESDGRYIPHCSCEWTSPDQPVVDDPTLAHLLTLHHVQQKAREAGYPLLDGTGVGAHPDQYRTKGAAPYCRGCGYYHHPDEGHYRAQYAGHRIDPQEHFEHDPGDDSITEDYARHIHHQTEPGTHKRYPYDKPQYDPSRWGRGGFVEGAKDDKAGDPPSVSGVVLKAADTGRVLMLQRALEDEKDPARGTWEFPGGHHEDGDKHSLDAAIREFEEEVGQPFPEGGHLTHVWRSGPYVGHVVVVPEEKVIKFDHGRIVPNPDDPDGDNSEQVAWWDPDHAKKNPALREECKGNPWNEIKKAAKGTIAAVAHSDACTSHAESSAAENWAQHRGLNHTDLPLDYGQGGETFQQAQREVEQWAKSYQENGDITTDGCPGCAARDGHTAGSVEPVLKTQWQVVSDADYQQAKQDFAEAVMAELHDEPEPALPTTDSESMAMGLQDDVTEAREDLGLPPLPPVDAAAMLRQHQAAMESGNVEASPFAHLMAGTQRSDDIAGAAKEFLAKEGLKSFTPAERKELIEEGLDVQAANLDRLDIAGTHYEALDRATAARDEDDSVANFMMWG